MKIKLLTKEQKKWLSTRKIKPGKFYMFPRFGFQIYDSPSYLSSERMDTNPFTRSLDHEFFDAKERVGDFIRGNFRSNPISRDFYLSESELSRRDTIEIIFLLIFTTIPMIIYNNVSR